MGWGTDFDHVTAAEMGRSIAPGKGGGACAVALSDLADTNWSRAVYIHRYGGGRSDLWRRLVLIKIAFSFLLINSDTLKTEVSCFFCFTWRLKSDFFSWSKTPHRVLVGNFFLSHQPYVHF